MSSAPERSFIAAMIAEAKPEETETATSLSSSNVFWAATTSCMLAYCIAMHTVNSCRSRHV
jgi:hypothetical protein